MANEPGVTGLLTVGQAIEVIDSEAVRPRVVRSAAGEAVGRWLARAVVTDRDYPPFDKSRMDGYAVRRADVGAPPVELKIVGAVAAGQWPAAGIGPGETMAIMTGAPLPPGAEGVVPVEEVRKVGPSAVRILGGGDPGRFVARRGSDCPAGRVVLPAGVRIGPAQVAAAMTVGATELEVFAAPKVAVLTTGDELVPADQTPGLSQIRNSNGPMLVALLRQLGCDVTDLGSAPDQPEAIRVALETGLAHDALFVAGGMSMGEHDYVPRLLSELGVELKITKLRIKPGKPFVFGVRESHFVFGLPGNPVSAFVCTVRLASRLLTRLEGGTVQERWLDGALSGDLPANGSREFYQPAIRVSGRDGATVTPLGWKGSADLFTLAQANCLLVRAENEPPVAGGTIVRVLEI